MRVFIDSSVDCTSSDERSSVKESRVFLTVTLIDHLFFFTCYFSINFTSITPITWQSTDGLCLQGESVIKYLRQVLVYLSLASSTSWVSG